jgi:uncharacterized membrane protein YgcG
VGGPELHTVDDERLPRPPAVQGKLPRSLLRLLVRGESLMFVAIAVALVVIAVAVFVRGVHDLVLAPHGEQFAVTITRAVNSALFIVVILELGAGDARREGGGFQLRRSSSSGSSRRPGTSSRSGRNCHLPANRRRWSAQ